MFKINDYVIYRNDLCRVDNIKKDLKTDINYYVLNPIEDSTLVIKVPVNNELGVIRKLITKEEVEEIIDDIPNIPIIKVSNDKLLEQHYKKLLQEGTHKNYISIIKTTYLRNKDRIDNNKKIGEKDDIYFKKVEKILYNEFSIVLGMSYNETKKYVLKKVEEISKNE